MRIAKYIANAGYCSRRDAEKLILAGKITINNKQCIHPSEKINNNDKVKIGKKSIILESKTKLWKIYKPIKYICSNKDQKKRKIIFDLIPPNYPRLISIGRLDYMTEGLLLFTNNGDFARKLELPKSNYERIYRMCIRGKIDRHHVKKINSGLEINNIFYKKIHIKIEKFNETFTWLIIKLREGKNREIRNICKKFSWKINKLIRIQYGPYKLSKLKLGEIKEIKKIY